jgi:hypothetical protein
VNNILYEKLQRLGIPDPPEDVTDSKVTRWGHNKRYWAVRFTGGYAIGDWASNLKDFVFEDGFDYKKCRKAIEEAQRKLTKERNAAQPEKVQQLTQNPGETTCNATETAEIEETKKEKDSSQNDEQEITDSHIPEDFKLTEKALYHLDRRNGSIYLCSYLRVLSKTVNIDTNESGKLLEFKTIHGEIKKICMRSKASKPWPSITTTCCSSWTKWVK